MNITGLFTRQLDLVRPTDLEFPILVIGAGGIGSWATLALAKMGCSNITVVDFDIVEKHNVPSQLYTVKHLRKPKVMALKEIIFDLTNTTINPYPVEFDEYMDDPDIPEFPKVIVCAVDSLEARRKIWTKLIDRWYINRDWEFFIDARMGGELLRIFGVNPQDIDSLNHYQQKLFNKKVKAAQEPCTGRAIVYNTFMSGGMIAHLVKKYAKREEIKFDVTYDISNQTTV